jgi:archaellum component FlaC
MTLNPNAVEIINELGSISDELDSIWHTLYGLEFEECSEIRKQINDIDKRVLRVANKLDITKKITI